MTLRAEYIRLHREPQGERAAFGAIIVLAVEVDDVNFSTLARRWGVPEETLRNWRDKGNAPTFDRLLLILPRMSERVFLETLRTLAGHRATVAIVDKELPERVTMSDLRAAYVETYAKKSGYERTVLASMADNVITPAERDTIDRASAERDNATSFFDRLLKLFTGR